MTKSELRAQIKEYIDVIKERGINGYTLEGATLESVALRNAELNGAFQAAESILGIIESQMGEDDE